MQIENHKEEVPFEHYQKKFEQADPEEISQRTGVKWEDGKFQVKMLDTLYTISHPAYAIHPACALPVQTFLLRYLLVGAKTRWHGKFKTFREMSWGELYIKPYTGRVLSRAAFTFGMRLDDFKAACKKMGGIRVYHGDAGYMLELLPNFGMQIMIWRGDDEFSPSAQILYTDNFETGFAPEDRVVAGDILISAIKENM